MHRSVLTAVLKDIVRFISDGSRRAVWLQNCRRKSGVQRLLLDSVRSIISLLISRKVRTNNVTKRHYYINSICFSVFHFPVLETRF